MLGRSGCLENKRILLLESSSRKKLNLKDYSLRVCALNPGSKSLLQSLGAWQHIEATRCAPVKKMQVTCHFCFQNYIMYNVVYYLCIFFLLQVWDACSDAAITFGKADLSENIAWIVENDLIQDSLMKEVDQQCQIEVQYKTKVTNYLLPQNSDEPVQVTLEDGTSLSTNLIVSRYILFYF